MNKIEVRNLSKSFGSHEVLHGLDLDVRQGKSLVILGGSGSGKSVLMKLIVGLIAPDSGSVVIDGEETVGIEQSKRFELMSKIGYLFQAGALFDSLTIEDNITFYMAKILKLNLADKRELALQKLKLVGLNERVLALYPADLSGGMQKRVALARAICANPEIIFFDEPTSGLDPIMSNIINELIVRLKETCNATTITITHSIASAQVIADDVAMLADGKILWLGDKAELFHSSNKIVDQFVHGRINGPIQMC